MESEPNKPVFTANPGDVERAGKAIFEFRQRETNDADPRYRHPMMYKGYKWEGLPASEKIYYCDMAISAFVSMGITVPVAPAFEAA